MTRFAAPALLAFLAACGPDRSLPYLDPRAALERRVEDLLGRLTTAERHDVLVGAPVARLGVPALRVAERGQGKLRSGLALAATWNPDLIARQARAAAHEAQAKGYDEFALPDVAQLGEDPYLASRIEVASVGAVQGEGMIGRLGGPDRETSRQPDDRLLQELTLPAYRAAVEEAGLWSVAPGGGDTERIARILDADWGFKGFVAGASDGGADREEGQLRGILRAMVACGFFDPPPARRDPDPPSLARALSGQAIVLLRNEGGLLPLETGKVRSIAVIGPLPGIRERGSRLFQMTEDSGASVAEAAATAGRAEVAIVTGSPELIAAVEKSNPKTVAVLAETPPGPMEQKLPAILESWGDLGAIADVVFGDVNPSGKLPVTLPADAGSRGEGIFTGYRYFDKYGIRVLYPFGHGLSYTTFTYSDLRIAPVTPRYGQLVQVFAKVRNSGSRAGAEVVELYIHQAKSSVERPPKELKAFRRVELKAGEGRDVTFDLDRRALWFYDPAVKDWAVEPGVFEVLIGASSRDIRLRGSFELFR